MQLAVGTMAVGFAALAGAIGQSAAQKPLARGDLSDAGAEVALGRREFGTNDGLDPILYKILYKIEMESKGENTIRICSRTDQA